MKFKSLILLFLLASLTIGAQQKKNEKNNNYSIEINAPTNANAMAYFAQYWDGQVYAIDSVMLSDQGKAIITSPKALAQGQYLLYVKPDIELELLIGNWQSNIVIDIVPHDLAQCKISGSNDTKILWQYLLDTQNMSIGTDKLKEELENESLTSAQKNELSAKLAKVEKSHSNYVKKLIGKHKKDWGGIFIKSLQPITLPYNRPKNRTEEDANWVYGKEHYFDNINLKDPRFWNTNNLTTMIDSYMKNWVEQEPDSLAAAADRLVTKTQGNKTCFKFMLSHFVNQSMKSNIMGMENVWAELAENYILERNVDWITKEQMDEIKAEYEKIKNNRIGVKAQNLEITDINGMVINTNQLNSELLLIYFYSPNCGHCMKEVPALYNNVYLKYKDQLEIVAMDINNDRPVWEKFISDHQLHEWINACDPEFKTQYWMYYNTSKIPAMFLLDKNKKIIARNIDTTNLEKILKNYLGEK